jgi:hypothetical protein
MACPRCWSGIGLTRPIPYSRSIHVDHAGGWIEGCRATSSGAGSTGQVSHSIRRAPIFNLPERYAQPVLFTPYDAALSANLTGLHDQLELMGNNDRVWHVKRGAAL